jgi:hypothetical protein
MGPRSLRRDLSILFLGVVACGAAQACEPVPGVPATLENGKFCLNFDVGVGGVAAFTLGNDVVLDCKGHRIRDLASTYAGVVVSGSNAVLRNCGFEGFQSAVSVLSTASYFRILDNTFLEPSVYAINSFGTDGLIAGNTISASTSDRHQWLIRTSGIVDIAGNAILNAEAPLSPEYGARYGVSAYYNDGGVISRNVVRNVAPASGEQGIAVHANGGYPIIYRNILVATPGSGDIGMFCYGGDALSRANVVVGYPHLVGDCSL